MIQREMAHQSTETDDELLTRLRRGDEAAFVALYRRRQGAIYRFAMHMSGSATAAEDITQEVFLALLRQECGFDPERGTLSGYLFGIARKLVLRNLERGRAHVTLESEADDAVVLGCPIGTVRSRMHRARALLFEKLNQDRNPRLVAGPWKPMRVAI